jgi:uncharacterized protein RhaS with RHS repeats
MNGRIYDPLLGRFLSADIAIQSPLNLQSYNRYTYVMNNPLTMTDPTGWYSILGLEFTDGGGVTGFLKDSASYVGSATMGAVGDNVVAGYNAGESHMEMGFSEIANAHSGRDVTIGVLGMVAAGGDAVGTVMAVTPEGKAEKLGIEGAERLATKAESAVTHAAEKAEGAATAVEGRLEGAAPKSGLSSEVKPNTAPTAEEEHLTRYAAGKESQPRLERQAEASLANPDEKIHGISTTASPADPSRAHSTLPRSTVEKTFPVHNTPIPGGDQLHRTVEIPKPVTQEIKDAWNKLWGLK